jgi:hypothetical protein
MFIDLNLNERAGSVGVACFRVRANGAKHCAPLERYLFGGCLFYKHPAPTELVLGLVVTKSRAESLQ